MTKAIMLSKAGKMATHKTIICSSNQSYSSEWYKAIAKELLKPQ